MDTRILPTTDEGIQAAAEILKSGGLVAVPTETVYGLAGNALDRNAAKRIYAAKGRPSDNPLIVHISKAEQIKRIASKVPQAAWDIFTLFSPGPVTVVLPKADIIPYETTGGLDTVGIRLPANEYTQRLISLCGFPLAAPSANASGSPSPTSPEHVLNDLDGRINAVINGGSCSVGLESTVVSVDEDSRITILRPGYYTVTDFEHIAGKGNVSLAKGVTERLDDTEQALSPGMKYRHYAPNADIAIINGSKEQFEEYVRAHEGDGVFALVFGDEDVNVPTVELGLTAPEQAHNLFDALRKLDSSGAVRVYARCPEMEGLGLAVYNRLIRAAGFEIIEA
ncbi:MAG: threonylcarbamoyl-AMP synthase [Oscillospiraceae bacterium]|nr:threonylcarbamoyl-AMP synthase [Oscillospiraceae bacterium]